MEQFLYKCPRILIDFLWSGYKWNYAINSIPREHLRLFYCAESFSSSWAARERKRPNTWLFLNVPNKSSLGPWFRGRWRPSPGRRRSTAGWLYDPPPPPAAAASLQKKRLKPGLHTWPCCRICMATNKSPPQRRRVQTGSPSWLLCDRRRPSPPFRHHHHHHHQMNLRPPPHPLNCPTRAGGLDIYRRNK